MRSNYKPLGKYIRPVEERNNDLLDLPLMGLSVSKVFFPTIANLVGTDMSTYKIVYRNQFTYIADTSRRGDKIAIALNDRFDKMMVSQAYTPFEVNNTNELDPEYLMMWFRRPEFDRYARFKSHGSAREIFDWDEMCNTLLPVPSITKQREIVKEYNVIQNRIFLNQHLIQKLEETAQAIYKQWFVDFEFLDENGKPYKSNRGEMIWNEELQKEIPKGWEVVDLQEIILFKNGKSKPAKKGRNPVYGGNGIIEYVDTYNDVNVIAIGRVGAYCGSLYRILGKCWISDNAISAKSKINANMFSYYVLNDLNLNERSEGTGQPLITQGLLNGIRITMPEKPVISNFEIAAISTFKNQEVIGRENQKLTELKELLLSKLATIEG
jgi:type I restriction enzyme S subunit